MRVPEGIRQFGVNAQIQIGMGIVHNLIHAEMVETHQPIGLVKPVFAFQRWRCNGWQPAVVQVCGVVSGVVNAFQVLRGIQVPGKREYLSVAIGGCANDKAVCFALQGKRGVCLYILRSSLYCTMPSLISDMGDRTLG